MLDETSEPRDEEHSEDTELAPLRKRNYEETRTSNGNISYKKLTTEDANVPEATELQSGTASSIRSAVCAAKKGFGSALTNFSWITPVSFSSPGIAHSPVQHDLSFVDVSPRDVSLDGVIDIDLFDAGNVLSQHWIAKDVSKRWQSREGTLEIRATYLLTQPELTGRMRAILVDWLVDVHMKFRLRAEVLHLSVSIVDRYLSIQTISRFHLQLVGVSAMVIAAKYEEIYAPELGEFELVTDSAYSREQILMMEIQMLNSLGFRLDAPSTLRFLTRNLKALRACKGDSVRLVGHLAQYLSELALMDEEMLQYPCSHRAAAVTMLSVKLLCEDMTWNRTMQHYSGGYAEESLNECVQNLMRLLRNEKDRYNTNKLSAVKRKFSARKYCGIAKLAASLDLDGVFNK